jgi:hypothetical protein
MRVIPGVVFVILGVGAILVRKRFTQASVRANYAFWHREPQKGAVGRSEAVTVFVGLGMIALGLSTIFGWWGGTK